MVGNQITSAYLGIRTTASVFISVADALQDRGRQMSVYVCGKQLACVENLDSDFMCTRGFDLDVLDLEWLACTPAYGGLALDDLSGSFGHA